MARKINTFSRGFDGIKDAAVVCQVEYVNPKGSDYPNEIDTLYRTADGRYVLDSESRSEFDNSTISIELSIPETIHWVCNNDSAELDYEASPELRQAIANGMQPLGF